MARLFHILILVILTGILLTAGCTTLPLPEDTAANVTAEQPAPSSYEVTISQPDARSDLIRMDSDVYNAGEVVEFVVTNTALMPLECSNTPPDFRVIFQTASGRWAARMGPEVPERGNVSFLQKGESTKTYRFVTGGWDHGRYRIVSDCGVERDILIRVPVTATPASVICPLVNATNTTPWLKIDSLSDQYAARPFTITGTTNLPAGQELNYTIFSITPGEVNTTFAREGFFSTTVEEGSCGTNRWSAMGTSDTGYNRIGQFGTENWWEKQNMEPYLMQSPLLHASKIETPLLIEHQEGDLRCPVEQAEQLYAALKLQKKTVKFVRYPGEFHGMSRTGKPWHRIHRLNMIADWFGQFLKGPA